MVPRCLVQEPKNARPTKNSGIRFYRPSAINLLEYELARSTLILYYDPIIRPVELGLENSKRSTKYGNNTSLGLVKEAMFKFLIQGDVLKFLFFLPMFPPFPWRDSFPLYSPWDFILAVHLYSQGPSFGCLSHQSCVGGDKLCYKL